MWLELLQSVIAGNFEETLKETIAKLGMNVKEFSEASGVPEGTLYKIISGKRTNFRISTLKQIISTVRKLEGYTHKHVIGVVTSRGALDVIGKTFRLNDKEVRIKE